MLPPLMWFLTDSGYRCSLCGPQRFDSQPEKLSCHVSDTRKLPNTYFSQQQRNEPCFFEGWHHTYILKRFWDTVVWPKSPTWTDEPGIGIFANERDRRVYRISRPGFDCDSNRGNKQVGLLYSRDWLFLCAFTGKRFDDLLSWHRRKFTPEEIRSEAMYTFLRYAWRMGVLVITGRMASG